MRKSVYHKLQDLLPQLRGMSAMIAKQVMEHPNWVLEMRITDFAKKIGTSPASLVDFCKKLGFTGFREFRLALAQETSLLESLKPDMEKVSEVSRNYFDFAMEEIRESLKLITDDKLTKAAEALMKSKVVEIVAYGFDTVAARDLFLKLKQFGFQVNFFENPFLQSISASFLDEHACLVAISSSHSSRDLLDAAGYARKAGATLIAIAPPSSAVVDLVNVFLPVYVKTEVLPEGGFLTRFLQLFVIDMLLLKMLEMDKERFRKLYSHFEEVLRYKRRGDRGVF
ncbi:RpiR family transcriptional regulator [Thermotoga sp. Ku-13t]|uniref:MurR/RpiR family transcriptional regulator n=1 Tax=Thermotoga sp. Ku-13t TaxID=1755813 RepID=UPI0013EBEED6|nr:MurR/RpiR family transcriptional regulator [Thermotoga sp. Ku-13t]KAF2958913.1 RpiR family transcriptional regulator [Thermotoga sp. Ku-13t]